MAKSVNEKAYEPQQTQAETSSISKQSVGHNSHLGAEEVLSDDERLMEMARQAPPFYQNRNLLVLYLLMIPGCLVPAVTLGFDSAMMTGLQAVDTWNSYFGEPEGAILGIMAAILPLGSIAASPFVSWVGDRFGRRKGIFLGSTIMAIGGIIQGASIHTDEYPPTIGMFLASRFIIGMGIVFANSFAPILIGELAHPKDRQVATSLFQTTWYLGAILAAWTTFGTFAMPNQWAWRIPSLLQAAPALIQMVGIYFVPESPRWLIARGRSDEAKKILVKYHVNGREGDPFVEAEFAEMKKVIEAEMANETVWKDLIATPGNRKRLFLIIILGCFYQWSGNGLISYYLVRVLDTAGIRNRREQNIINGCMNIFNWFTAISSAFLTAKLRRRTQFLISTAGVLVVFSAQTLCAALFNEQDNQVAGKTTIGILFLFYAFYNLAWNALIFSYPMEVLPYPIRAKGYAILMFVGKAANFINSLVNPIGLNALEWKYYLVYVVWLCIEVACVYFFVVETKGPSLEAIAARFDKF